MVSGTVSGMVIFTACMLCQQEWLDPASSDEGTTAVAASATDDGAECLPSSLACGNWATDFKHFTLLLWHASHIVCMVKWHFHFNCVHLAQGPERSMSSSSSSQQAGLTLFYLARCPSSRCLLGNLLLANSSSSSSSSSSSLSSSFSSSSRRAGLTCLTMLTGYLDASGDWITTFCICGASSSSVVLTISELFTNCIRRHFIPTTAVTASLPATTFLFPLSTISFTTSVSLSTAITMLSSLDLPPPTYLTADFFNAPSPSACQIPHGFTSVTLVADDWLTPNGTGSTFISGRSVVKGRGDTRMGAR
ncbi:hypothetical protein EW146_g1823 [Bondarzewia mesenterica]|uniref:Uncharacterized protein n=1 Tax=Bondarzewia mesenterica TaxID=1095465 RepID=A0A4S4M4G2_9AGAM|nr:hypothetical protein EW146_g1823 [Bondarzewia mesenterica]